MSTIPSRKRRKVKEEIKETPEDLRKKLREKLKEKGLERTSRMVRNQKAEKLEEDLKTAKSPAQRRRIKKELKLIDKIEEAELNYNDDHPNLE